MIELDIPKNVTWIKGFRLLNSEIGNDHLGKNRTRYVYVRFSSP